MPYDRVSFGIYYWDFVQINGVPQVPTRQLKSIKMPGVDGVAFKFMSKTALPSKLELVGVALDNADEVAWIQAMAELSGRQVSYYDSTGIGYHDQVFHEVAYKGKTPVIAGKWKSVNLGSDGRLVVFEATLQYPYGS